MKVIIPEQDIPLTHFATYNTEILGESSLPSPLYSNVERSVSVGSITDAMTLEMRRNSLLLIFNTTRESEGGQNVPLKEQISGIGGEGVCSNLMLMLKNMKPANGDKFESVLSQLMPISMETLWLYGGYLSWLVVARSLLGAITFTGGYYIDASQRGISDSPIVPPGFDLITAEQVTTLSPRILTYDRPYGNAPVIGVIAPKGTDRSILRAPLITESVISSFMEDVNARRGETKVVLPSLILAR